MLPYSIRLEKPETSLGELMSAIREWLDNHKIEPVECKTAQTSEGIALEIRFQHQEEVTLFEQAFA